MNGLIKSATGIFLITLISKFLGIGREMVLAYKYSASNITDAYVIATTIPTVIFSILLSGISRSYIPIYTRINTKEEKKKFDSNIVSIMVLISTGLVAVFFIFKRNILAVLAPGFDMETYSLALKMAIIIIFVLPVRAIFNILAGYLNCKEDFLMLNFCNSIVINIFVILSIIVSSYEHIIILPILYVLGEILALGILWMYSAKAGFEYQPYINLNNKEVKELISLAVPMGLSIMANQLNTVTDRALASSLKAGIMTALNYADKLQLIVLSLTVTIIATVSYPKLNQFFAENRLKDALEVVNKGLMITTFICLPSTFVLIIFAEPIVRTLFERGSFDASNTIITSQCLIGYAIGLMFYGYREIISQALAANKLQKRIFTNSVFAVCLNIGFDFILIKPLGHLGLALATSIVGFISALLLYRTLIKEVGQVGNMNTIKEVLKMLLAAVLAAVVIILLYPIFNAKLNSLISLIMSIMINIILYFFLCHLFKAKTYNWILSFGGDFLNHKCIK